MGYLKYVKQAFLKPSPEQERVQRDRLLQIRREPVTNRIARPTRPDRARALGWKAKPGFLIVRQRVPRGGHTRGKLGSGRRPRRYHQRRDLSKNYQQIAEERACRKLRNCEVLGSYPLVHDGKHTWYEVILIDRNHPQILADTRVRGVAKRVGKAFRGLTSAGRKSRGLRRKGTGTENVRPSRRANSRR